MTALDEAMGRELTTLAFLWRLRRRDGVEIGFTSHDRDMHVEGLRFSADPGMSPSAVSMQGGFAPADMEVSGVVSDGFVTRADIAAGRWDGAAAVLMMADWAQASVAPRRLFRGRVRSVRLRGFGGSSFVMELESELSDLERSRAMRTGPLCRAELGDVRCGVDMDGRSRDLDFIQTSIEQVRVPALKQAEAGRYAIGRLRFLTGGLAGVDRAICSVEGDQLLLDGALPTGGAEGRLRLWEGCDKRFETCRAVFANGAGFVGEPHVPGEDSLLRYGDF